MSKKDVPTGIRRGRIHVEWEALPRSVKHRQIVKEHMEWLKQHRESGTVTDFSLAPIAAWYTRYAKQQQERQQRVGDTRSVRMRKRRRAEKDRKAKNKDKN